MEPYPFNSPKSSPSLSWLVKQGIFFLFLTGLLIIFVLIFAILLIPIGIQLLWKRFTKSLIE